VRREPALWPAGVAAAVLLGVSFFVLQHWLEHGALSDVPVYVHYARLIRSGQLPYRGFAVEYPPAALAAFVVPSYLPWSYATSFAVAMGVCGAGCLLAAAAVLRGVRARPDRIAAALLAIGVSPLLLGSLFDSRFDLLAAMLAVAALAAVVHERPWLGGGLLGLAAAAKLWPLVLLPVALAYLWRRRGTRAAAALGVGLVAAVAACTVPFAALAPAGVWHSLTVQLDRPLQVESLGAAVLMVAQHLGGVSLTTVTTHGSQNLAGGLPDAVAAASTVLAVVVVATIWIRFARVRRPGGDSVVVASAAAVATLVAFGKVFSPQFLIWLVPLVPLVRGRRGLAATLLLFTALGLTQTWFPDGYWQLALRHSDPYAGYLLLRDLAVVAIAVVLAWPARLQDEALGKERSRLEALRSIRPQVE